MDSKSVLVSLLELFPQIDSRLLKATAIEHYDDVNAAVGFVVNEVLPTLYGSSDSFCSTHGTQEVSNQACFSDNAIRKQTFEACQHDSFSCGAYVTDITPRSSPPLDNKPEENVRDSEINDHHCKLPSSLENKPNSIALDSWVDISSLESSRNSVERTDTVPVALEPCHGKSSSVNTKRMDVVEYGVEAPNASNESCCVVDDKCKILADTCSRIFDHDTEVVSLEENPGFSISQSVRLSHIMNGDVLQNCDRNAKNSKTTLVAEVESAVDLEEPPEHLAEGQDIDAVVQELEQILQHAKQAKDIHAGEVNGEKAILASEARQFQSRLLSFSNEKNKAFSITNELCEILKTRIAAAKEALATTQTKSEKENLLQLALKEQEALMDTIVQDSKKLQQEAEENTKLREFLVDHGRVVDTLQGEMAVIMEDLMLLKKLVDEQAPIKGTMLLKTYGASSSSSSSSSSSNKSLSSNTVSKNSKESNEEEHSKKQEQERCIDTTCSGKLSDYTEKQSWALDDDWEMLRNGISPSTTPS